MNSVERLPVWRADAEWADEVEVVRAGDYEALAADNARLRAALEAQEAFWAQREHELGELSKEAQRVRTIAQNAIDAALDGSVEGD